MFFLDVGVAKSPRAWWTPPQLQLPFIGRLAAHVATGALAARGVEDALVQFDVETGLLGNCWKFRTFGKKHAERKKDFNVELKTDGETVGEKLEADSIRV